MIWKTLMILINKILKFIKVFNLLLNYINQDENDIELRKIYE